MKWQSLVFLTIVGLLLLAPFIPLSNAHSIYYTANTYPFTFPTYSTKMGFDSDMIFSRAYRINDYWYFNTSTVTENWGFRFQQSSGTGAKLLVTDFFETNASILKFNVNATVGLTTTTKVYVPSLGEPTGVYGASSYSYDVASKVETVNVVHAVMVVSVEIRWGEVSDITPPTYSDVSHNTTVTGQPCKFSSLWEDETGLSGYIFGYNGTGSWSNESWVAFGSNPAWANKTKTLPGAGTKVSYRWYGNDTSDNWASTSIYTLTVTGTGQNTLVLLSTPMDGAVVTSKNQSFTFIPTIYQQIENGSLWLNLSGTWQVGAWNTTTILNNTINTITYVFSSSGVYTWNIGVYNTTHATFAEANRTITVTLEPWYTSVSASTTLAGYSCTFSAQLYDGDGLSGYIFSWNGTGNWGNNTWVIMTGSPLSYLATASKTLPTTSVHISYRFYANDTDNLWLTTTINTFQVVVPTITGATNLTFYLRSDTWTKNTVTGYQLGSENSNAEGGITDQNAGNVTVQFGYRLWILHSRGTTAELTDGTPQITLTRTQSGSGYQSTTFLMQERSIILGWDSLEAVVYMKFASGSWLPKATFVSSGVMTKKFLTQTWTLTLYTTKAYSGGVTTASFRFGDSSHASIISNVGIKEPLTNDIQAYYLSIGDFISFLFYGYYSLFGQSLFFGLMLFIGCATMYIRYRNLGPILFMFVIFGGAGGLIWALVPAPAVFVVWIILLIGLTALIFRVIR